MDGQNTRWQEANSNANIFNRRRNLMKLKDLPSTDTKRWVVRHKAAVVAAVKSGVITLDEVYRRYDISDEEFVTWQELIERHGIRGLRVTRLKEYRKS
jgi:hypothetical protein